MRHRLAGIVSVLVLVPGIAAGHVKTDVPEAPAAGRFTFSFAVDHGCAGSPTTALRIQLPDGSFDARPVYKPGWAAEVAGEPPVVHIRGGPLPDDVTDTFSVELVTPNRPGEEVLFPTVQTCEVGQTSWIAEDASAPTPAPRVRLTANDAPVTTAPPTTTAPMSAPLSTESTASPTDQAGEEAAAEDSGGGSAGRALAVAGAVTAAAGSAVWAARRRRPSN